MTMKIHCFWLIGYAVFVSLILIRTFVECADEDILSPVYYDYSSSDVSNPKK